MKKKILLMLPVLMLGISLVACDEPAPTYTPEEAIQHVAENLPTLFLDAAGMPGRLKKTYDVLPGDSFIAMTAYSYQETLDVTIAWTSNQTEKVTIKPVTLVEGMPVQNRVLITFKTGFYREDEFDAKITGTISCGEATPVEVYFNTDVGYLEVTETDIKSFKEGYKDAQYNKDLATPTFNNSDTVSVYGYITATFEPSTDHLYTGVWIQNGEDGIQLYAGNLSKLYFDLELQQGDLIRAIGYGSGYNGLLEIKPQLIEKVDEVGELDVTEPIIVEYANADGWSKDDLKNKDGNLIVMKNLTLKTAVGSFKPGSHWTIKMEGTKSDGTTKVEVQLYVNYHIGNAAQEAVLAKLKTMVVGTTVFDLIGPISWYNAPQFNLAFVGELSPVDTITIHS